MTKLPGLSIVVLCYNEEATLAGVIGASRHVGAELADAFEVIVINDGSVDGSAAIADAEEAAHDDVRVVHHPKNLGFGAGQQSGIAHARMEYITIVPADGQFAITDLAKLAELAPSNDIVLGYREDRQDSAYRSLKTRAFGWWMRLFFGVEFRDVNWVKMYHRRVFEAVDVRANGIGVEAEIVVKAKMAGLRLTETLVGYRPRIAGVAKGDQIHRVIGTILELLRLRLQTIGWKPRPFHSRPITISGEATPSVPRQPSLARCE